MAEQSNPDQPTKDGTSQPEAQPQSNLAFTDEDRKAADERLRAQYGDQWMKDNKAMLDSQWEYIQTF